eukprot:m.209637 g.209637  ORF g.209637 m.209637 type:complete len:388 (+) comp18992_c0_seq1:217-1380(+)
MENVRAIAVVFATKSGWEVNDVVPHGCDSHVVISSPNNGLIKKKKVPLLDTTVARSVSSGSNTRAKPVAPSVDVIIQDMLAKVQSHSLKGVQDEDSHTSVDEVFFEFANVKTLGYRCQDDTLLAIQQHPAVDDCTGGVVWETAVALAMFLESKLKKFLSTVHVRKHIVVEVSMNVLSLSVVWSLSDSFRITHTHSHTDTMHMRMYRLACVCVCVCANNSHRCTRVPQLGAGCGLLGLVLARAGYAVVLTEVSQAMEHLAFNVDKLATASGSRNAVATQLFWGSKEDIACVQEVMSSPHADAIVATDVIFADELVAPLLQTMHALCGPHTVVFVCVQERSATAHALFLKQAADQFARVEHWSERLWNSPGCSFARECECELFVLAGPQ